MLQQTAHFAESLEGRHSNSKNSFRSLRFNGHFKKWASDPQRKRFSGIVSTRNSVSEGIVIKADAGTHGKMIMLAKNNEEVSLT